MCSLQPEDIPVKDPLNPAVNQLCIKCKQVPSTINIRFAVYCDSCFLVQAFHKYRSAIGKTRKRTEREHILIFLDTVNYRMASFVLLLMSLEAIQEDLERRHADHFSIVCNQNDPLVNEICSTHGLLFHHVFVSDTYKKLENLSSSASQDLLNSHILKSVAAKALELHADKVYAPFTCNDLAISIFNLVIKGMGEILPWEMQTVKRQFGIDIVRPLRDHHQLEISEYLRLKLPNLIVSRSSFSAGISGLTESFFSHLDSDYSATVSTVAKTAGKVTSEWHSNSNKYVDCTLCGTPSKDTPYCYACVTNLVELPKESVPEIFGDIRVV